MKRTALKRKPRRPKPGDDPGYKRWLVENCRCVVCVKMGLDPREYATWQYATIDPAHTGRNAGRGLKAPDRHCAPLCRHHHDERDKGIAGKFAFDEKWDMVREAEVHFKAYEALKEAA